MHSYRIVVSAKAPKFAGHHWSAGSEASKDGERRPVDNGPTGVSGAIRRSARDMGGASAVPPSRPPTALSALALAPGPARSRESSPFLPWCFHLERTTLIMQAWVFIVQSVFPPGVATLPRRAGSRGAGVVHRVQLDTARSNQSACLLPSCGARCSSWRLENISELRGRRPRRHCSGRAVRAGGGGAWSRYLEVLGTSPGTRVPGTWCFAHARRWRLTTGESGR